MYWRRFAMSSIPLTDAKEFEQWLLDRWREKDSLLEQWYDTGRFLPTLDPPIPKTASLGTDSLKRK